MINVNLRQLRFLVAIHEERSFTAAAKRVNATQSGLSMQIKELEERLGMRLFDRSSTGVTPTSAGDRLYKRATRILREVSAIESDVQMLAGQVSGRIHVGMMPAFARAVLAPVLERFARQYPRVEIKVTEAYSAVLCEDVTSGNLDMAVVPAGKLDPGLRAEHLASDVEVFVTSGSTDRTHLEPVDLGQCTPLKLALPGPGNARRERLDTYLETYRVPIEAIMELDTMMATLDLVAQSDWTTILPGCLCLPEIDRPLRKLHPLSNPPLLVDYVFIEPASQSKTQAAELFATEIVKAIREACDLCQTSFEVAQPPTWNQ